VRSEITVEAPIERAFAVFTEEMQTWWNPDHHLIETAEMVVEPRVGGNIVDRGPDGSECRWSRVLAYEPPTLFVFSRDINTRWELEPDPGWESMRDAVGSGWADLVGLKDAIEGRAPFPG
jgi:uncharacterized protein YndB with AHSA1/START domain